MSLARSLAAVAILGTSLVAACGGGDTPAPKTAHAGDGSTKTDGTKSGPAQSKKPSKYPDPFLEPVCAEPQQEGHLANAKQVTMEVRRKNWDRLAKCADEATAEENLDGEIRIRFRLDSDGVPRCVENAGSTLSNEEVIRCVIATYRTFQYPSPTGTVYITESFRLEKSDDDD
jgi:hypothetical protein